MSFRSSAMIAVMAFWTVIGMYLLGSAILEVLSR